MRVVLFIGKLSVGGAEKQMVNLAKGLARRGHTVFIVTFFPGGQNGQGLEKVLNLQYVALNGSQKESGGGRLLQLIVIPFRLRRVLADLRPDAIYSMLHLSNLYAWLATRGRYSNRLVWGYRASAMRLNLKRLLPERACKLLSPTVPLMIANSIAGAKYATEKRGFRPHRIEVVQNGIDTEFFSPKQSLGRQVREEFRIPEDEVLVGIVGRIDPMKGHDVFLKAAHYVCQQRDRFRFIIVGGGPTARLARLKMIAEELEVSHRIIWAGNRADMVAIYSSLDILVSSSYGEGFSNVIGEAMACGTPCAVTDVGDSAAIVGQYGRVVPPGNPGEIARQLLKMHEWQHNISQEILRKRIVDCYSIKALCKRTEFLLKEVAGG